MRISFTPSRSLVDVINVICLEGIFRTRKARHDRVAVASFNISWKHVVCLLALLLLLWVLVS